MNSQTEPPSDAKTAHRSGRLQLSQGTATVIAALLALAGVAIGHILTSWTSQYQTDVNVAAQIEQQGKRLRHEISLQKAKQDHETKLERLKFVQQTIAAVIGRGTGEQQRKTLRFYATIGVIEEPYAKKILDLPLEDLPVATVPTTESSREVFFNRYRVEFGRLSAGAESALTRLFGYIEKDQNVTDIRQVAYILATVKYETGEKYEPVVEFGDENRLFNLYDIEGERPHRARVVGNLQPGDGVRYRGRGFLLLTGRVNYEKVGKLLGIDLVGHPERMLEPQVAYGALAFGMLDGMFTGKKLGDYVNDNKTDYVRARRVVNALDHASLIASYAEKFEIILRDSLGAKGTVRN